METGILVVESAELRTELLSYSLLGIAREQTRELDSEKVDTSDWNLKGESEETRPRTVAGILASAAVALLAHEIR